jgi:hypothetical protein
MGSVAERYFQGQRDNHVEETGSDLDEALSDVAYVSRILHGVESGNELNAETLCDLCVCLFNAQRRLSALKQGEGRAHDGGANYQARR